ncbi:TIGR01212 family radical SAM protein [Arcobacter sp. FWKO B]|uniref:TIGR01212 family radical SAM protein n=1 Tax=Arcobacter sp. FWKO B TaxID=2593672 RepID=UPI0018A616EB|nr:TIGR01212 family radical SAM protein [Arcobacter sp. FWKO B]QOG11705.1 TIGR01212 family radical SAM protein [Arcobacter sp. FWKO B]
MSEKLKPLNTIGRYFRKKFGQSVYKIPISISGFTCPNIDGTVAKGGCTFCENDSFSPNLAKNSKKFKLHPTMNENPYLTQQIQQLKMQYYATKTRLEKKFGAKQFIVYFQSFTNTYAPINTLKTLYSEALLLDDVVGLSVGTRSDCVNEEILEYLQQLSHQTNPNSNQANEIWVEYGIQTIYDTTLEKINRGHDYQNVKEWIKKTKEYGLLVCGHIIFGLPDETKEMMLNTIKETIKLNIDSIKIHPLYVTNNTLLALEYKNGEFDPINEEDYIELLIETLKILPKNITIQRLTAGINNASLVAPQWCNDKHTQMANIKKALQKANISY